MILFFRNDQAKLNSHYRYEAPLLSKASTLSPIQCVSGATSLAVTQPGHKDDQSPPTSTGVENAATLLLTYMPSQSTEEHLPSLSLSLLLFFFFFLIQTYIHFTAVLFPTCSILNA